MAPEQPVPGGSGGSTSMEPIGGQLELVNVGQPDSLESLVQEIRQGQRFGRSTRRVYVPQGYPEKFETIVAERVH